MAVKLPKIVFCADLSEKSKSIKAIYLYPFERPRHAISENSMFYSGLSNSSRDIEAKNIKKVLTQQKFNKIHQLQMLISFKF